MDLAKGFANAFLVFSALEEEGMIIMFSAIQTIIRHHVHPNGGTDCGRKFSESAGFNIKNKLQFRMNDVSSAFFVRIMVLNWDTEQYLTPSTSIDPTFSG